MIKKDITLSQYLIEEQIKLPNATGDFTALMSHLSYASKIVSREVRKAGLLEHILGSTSQTNVQGETQMKLDQFADRIITNAMKVSGHLCVMASEENEGLIEVSEDYAKGSKYTFAFDPLDGSSNIDSNVSIGTIFSIHQRVTDPQLPANEKDMLQKGSSQKCAGYVVYGSSTIMVLTTGNGVVGFTLDPSCGEFLLSHPDIKIPESGKIYSINEGNHNYWDDSTKAYIQSLKDNSNGKSPKTARYIGSLVADFHRNLLKGGIFLYPKDTNTPNGTFSNGKLRLLYEVAPMAMIVKQAGGFAVDADGNDLLDVQPTELHQRISFVAGSKTDVEHYLNFRKKYPNK